MLWNTGLEMLMGDAVITSNAPKAKGGERDGHGPSACADIAKLLWESSP
jgi:hypothetical protein